MIGAISAGGNPGRFLRSIQKNAATTDQALERLMTGKRINRPSDDPAGFISAELLRGEISRLQSELKGIDRTRQSVHEQQSGLENIHEQLVELRGMLVSVADGLLTPEQRQQYADQIASSLEAIDKLRQELSGGPNRSNDSHRSNADYAAVANGDNAEIAQLAARTDAELDSVSFSRAALAAQEKYELDTFEHLAQDSIVIHTEALSHVEDADFAEEAAKLASSQVLAAGAIAALVKSGEIHLEQVEALLEGVDGTVDELPE